MYEHIGSLNDDVLEIMRVKGVQAFGKPCNKVQAWLQGSGLGFSNIRSHDLENELPFYLNPML